MISTVTYTPVWVDFPTAKEGRGRKLDSGYGGRLGQTHRKAEV